MSWQELRYRPHRARVGDAEIVVVVRDRDLSNAQESGMEAGWFIDEVRARTRHCDFPPLVTTATDGDNGGWFRNTTDGSNFWSGFYRDLVERVRAGRGGRHPPRVHHRLPATGTARTAGSRSSPVPGTPAITTARASSSGPARRRSATPSPGSRELSDAVAAALARRRDGRAPGCSRRRCWRVLRAETSCNFYWGEAWVERCHHDLDAAAAHLDYALTAR